MALLTPRPTSPAEGLHFQESFVGNGVITTNLIGQNKWTLVGIGNAGTVSYLTTILSDDPPAGGVRMLTAGTADGDGDAMHMLANNSRFSGRGSGGLAFRFRYPGIAGNVIAANNFYIGVHTTVTATEPTDGIYIQSLGGVMSLRVDSADHGDSIAAFGGGTTLTSGTTAVLDVPHQVEVHWSGTNGQGGPRVVEAFCDNVPVGSVITPLDDDENARISIVHWQNQGGAQTYEFDVHWFEYWQYLNYPTAPAV